MYYWDEWDTYDPKLNKKDLLDKTKVAFPGMILSLPIPPRPGLEHTLRRIEAYLILLKEEEK